MKKIYSKLIAVLAVVAMTTMFSSCDKFGNTDNGQDFMDGEYRTADVCREVQRYERGGMDQP